MSTLDVITNDISCQHCKDTIEHGLAHEPGVSSVEVDIDTKAVHVAYDEHQITPETIRAKLVEIGYPAS